MVAAAAAIVAITSITVAVISIVSKSRARWPLCRIFVEMHAHLPDKTLT